MKKMMDEEEWKSLELKVISCRDLKASNLFQKLSVYAVVSILSEEEDNKQNQIKTGVDGGGGGNPEWNQVMQFDLRPYHHKNKDVYFVKFKLRCGGGVVFGKRSIGEVIVPLKNLMEDFNGSARFVSYQVSTTEGKPNGVLNFSYSLKGNKKSSKLLSSSSSSNYKMSSLYPCLDDIASPAAAAAASSQHPFPVRYPTQTLAYAGSGFYPSINI